MDLKETFFQTGRQSGRYRKLKSSSLPANPTMAATTTTKLSLKLLVNTSTNKVLFAEAGKDFVDFLLGLLALPIGTVIHLLSEQRMVGSLGKLHGSLRSLGEIYLKPGFDKDLLLCPPLALAPPNTSSLLQYHDDSSKLDSGNDQKKFYVCGREPYICGGHLWTDIRGTSCACGHSMNTEAPIPSDAKDVATSSENSTGTGGYVKGVITYMVMDNLVVTPMSTISGITLLNKFNITDFGSLEERLVEIGMDEGLKLLEVSLSSSTVLTDVLLKTN